MISVLRYLVWIVGNCLSCTLADSLAKDSDGLNGGSLEVGVDLPRVHLDDMAKEEIQEKGILLLYLKLSMSERKLLMMLVGGRWKLMVVNFLLSERKW